MNIDKAILLPEFDSPKNWTEDYSDRHNQYVCKCYLCKECFNNQTVKENEHN